AELAPLVARLEAAHVAACSRARGRLASLAASLDAMSPLSVLARGYAIVTDARGRAVRDAAEVTVGAEIEARLSRGRLVARVERVVDALGSSSHREDEA
ncbi:MAG TPA: exodeoxyribonuclease VII large subunit, partial [Byssovorax sp.]